jgi:hypothetical protein
MNTTRWLFIILAGFLTILSSYGIFADELGDVDSLSCPGGIVNIGDTRFSVLEKCGKPTFADNYGDLWVYDFGPEEFVRYVTFVGDEVERIQVGGYGKSIGRSYFHGQSNEEPQPQGRRD